VGARFLAAFVAGMAAFAGFNLGPLPATAGAGEAVTGIRIIAILAGIAVMATTQYGLAASSYIAFPLGILTYLLARYVGWAVWEHRRFKREMDGVIEKARRGEPFENSN
jgi:hypothetical protein